MEEEKKVEVEKNIETKLSADIAAVEAGVKWSRNKFWIGKLKNEFIAFIITLILVMVVFLKVVFGTTREGTFLTSEIISLLIIVFGSGFFLALIIFTLHKPISTAVASTKMSLELRKSMTADIAGIIDKLTKKSGN